MCGRYVSPETAAIEREFHIGRANSNPFGRRFNVLPSTQIPLIRLAEGVRELTEARWGFAPPWWKKPKPPTACFNARAEDAAGKPMWRGAYAGGRCIVPAEGWYEWQEAELVDSQSGEIKRVKQPHFILRADRRLVGLAGLMSVWHSRPGEPILTCALMTRAAAPSVADVHERMPVVIQDEALDAWLDPHMSDPREVARIIAAAQSEFVHYPVTRRLNSAKTDEEAFTVPVDGEGGSEGAL
jgi:putative SOS response-associated peptidase YedK